MKNGGDGKRTEEQWCRKSGRDMWEQGAEAKQSETATDTVRKNKLTNSAYGRVVIKKEESGRPQIRYRAESGKNSQTREVGFVILYVVSSHNASTILPVCRFLFSPLHVQCFRVSARAYLR